MKTKDKKQLGKEKKDRSQKTQITEARNLNRNKFWIDFVKFTMAKWPDFKIDEHNKAIIEMLLLYFWQRPEFENNTGFDLNKGILLRGNFGTGKTFIFDVLLHFVRKTPEIRHMRFQKIVAYGIESDFNVSGYKNLEKIKSKFIKEHYGYTSDRNQLNHLLIDDLGSEDGKASHFGTQTDIVKNILMHRYDIFRDHKVVTHLTTNLKPSEIREHYGERVYSRFLEMFNDIVIDGSDRRKPSFKIQNKLNS